ncbi:peroxiredoxin [Chitinophaga skermanii]|uniref:Peroxiredoxin n=1 Tax=Chitinophaga skermanii TaxID=331697 RepID=A0A327QQI5_9BACT|nr:redoxin domain-containing protein [Chitinophaga skermanii]RAJ04047.1 peroxiredoxin [Chitinophaga skermanii]
MSIYHRYADVLPNFFPENFAKPIVGRQLITPLRAGAEFPLFTITPSQIIQSGEVIHPNVHTPLLKFITRPLVIAFYSAQLSLYGQSYLDKLQQLYADVRVMGGSFLLVVAEDADTFEAWQGKYDLPFDIIHDVDFAISKSAGLYAGSDPLWGRVSGVDADVFAPAVYVVSPSGKIVYEFVDTNLTKNLDTRDLLTAVYQAGTKAVA